MGRIFASADWHGCGTIAKQIMDYLQPSDRLYFLGDAIDRGPDGIKILQMLMHDRRVVFIRGNHEDMMFKTYRGGFEDRYTWYYNGNEDTERDFNKLSKSEREEILDFIEYMPIDWTYKTKDKTIRMSHAGYTPGIAFSFKDQYLWDRGHFCDKWQEDYEDTYVIHGHTPVQYLKFEYGYEGLDDKEFVKEKLELKRQWMENGVIDWKPEVLFYCGGHKIDIDMCTIASDRIALLDLNTFECIYFDKKVED